jgi:hypothetical protein
MTTNWCIMIHNATTKKGIIGLTPPSRAKGTARGSERSRGPRAVPKATGGALNHAWTSLSKSMVEPIIPSKVWCYDIISQQSLSRPQNKTMHSYWELGDVIGPEIQHFNKLMHYGHNAARAGRIKPITPPAGAAVNP